MRSLCSIVLFCCLSAASAGKCCWSKWGDESTCGDYSGSGGLCNNDWTQTCTADSDCGSTPTPTPAPPTPTPPTPTPPTPTPPTPTPPTPPSPPTPAPPTPPAADFQVGGYLENWVAYDGYSNFNTIYYAFLTLDSAPNADNPNDKQWDGKAIYETMTLAPVLDVMNKTDPAYLNPYEWQRSKIAAVMDYCSANGKTWMWAVGGWSDLQRTISDEQIPTLVQQVVALLKIGGDGVDFDWEHLSTSSDAAVNSQQRSVLGKLISAVRKALDENGMSSKHISYTTRWNCFWTSADAHKYNALTFSSDGECIDNFAAMSSTDDVSWVNLMMYDAAPQTAFTGQTYFNEATYKTVLQRGAELIDKKRIIMGFEPGHQATDGVWEGFDIDMSVISYMKEQAYGGIMFWAVNEAASDTNADTPSSTEYSWKGTVGKNSQYIASLAQGSTKQVIV